MVQKGPLEWPFGLLTGIQAGCTALTPISRNAWPIQLTYNFIQSFLISSVTSYQVIMRCLED